MGGCRCAYKNCRKISDNVTHFFHFPVFDKQRCHTWIMNAQRPDLLKLTLAQLRNRVVCQHHFADDMFMNYMKNRLKHDAVPVEYRPSSAERDEDLDEDLEVFKHTEVQHVGDDESKFFTPREKIATLSFPYNQFLTQCNYETINDPSLGKSLPTNKKKKIIKSASTMSFYNNENSNKTSPDTPLEKVRKIRKSKRNKKGDVPNVIVLSETKLPIPIILKGTDTNVNNIENEPSKVENIKHDESRQQEIITSVDVNQEKINHISVNNDCINRHADHAVLQQVITKQNINLLKKVPIGFEQIETDGQLIKPVADLTKGLSYNKRKKSSEQQSSSPSIEKPKHKCRNPRKMSSLSVALLHKVNENSKDIAEIKNLLLQQNRESSMAKASAEQLSGYELEIRKKFLFDEISQYLSSGLKNDMYEELFLNIRKRKIK